MFSTGGQDHQAGLSFAEWVDLHAIVPLVYGDGLADVKTLGVKTHLRSFPRLCVARLSASCIQRLRGVHHAQVAARGQADCFGHAASDGNTRSGSGSAKLGPLSLVCTWVSPPQCGFLSGILPMHAIG